MLFKACPFVNFITFKLNQLKSEVNYVFLCYAGTKFSFCPPIINDSFENLFHFIEC